MKSLPINGILGEDTRLQSVILHLGEVYYLHRGKGDDCTTLYITKHGEPNEILMICREELWNKIFEKY
jgi:hypothetical protein